MSTSGTESWTTTRDTILKGALERIGVLRLGEALPDELVTQGTEFLNAMIKTWQAMTEAVWAEPEYTLFPIYGDHQYTIGPGSTLAHCTTSYVESALDGDVAAGASSVSVDSATGITQGDYIGVMMDDGTRHWTTISGIVSTTLSLTDVMAGAASDGAEVITYTNKAGKIRAIWNIRRIESNGTELLLGTDGRPMSRDEYMSIPNKTQKGPVTSVAFHPLTNTATLYTWPACERETTLLKFTGARILEDMSSAEDNLDFPTEWCEVAMLGLAVRWSSAFGIDVGTRYPSLAQLEGRLLAELTGNDRHRGDVIIKKVRR